MAFAVSAADAVKRLTAALNGAGLGIQFAAAAWPKYALPDLVNGDKWHVVAVWPARHDPIDEDGVAIEQPLAVTCDARIEKGTAAADQRTASLEKVANWLARNEVAGLGHPIEPLVVDRNEDALDKGHFQGGVGVVYRRYRASDEEAG